MTPLAGSELDRVASFARASKAESVAVCLLFSYLDPAHERAVAERLRAELPELHVSVSHEVLPQFREYERCSTTVIDAYLSPLLGRYLGRLAAASTGRGLPEPLVMRSSGGVAPAAEAAEAGAWSVLSGPAGGAVGAGLLATLSADGNVVGLDMGGTSCDVCVVEGGRVRRTDSRQIGGRVIQLPMVDVHTVGAGGGSIGWVDRGWRASRRAEVGRGRPGARLLLPRRHRAHGHRCKPPARLPGRRVHAGRRRGAGRPAGPRCRRAAWDEPSGSASWRPRRGS